MFLPKNYLRSARKRAGLTQRDVSYLLTYQPGCLSDLEVGRRTPLLRTVFAYQVLFGFTPEKLVPRKFDEVKKAVRIRAGMLADKLSKQKTASHLKGRVIFIRKIERGDTCHQPIAYEDKK